MAVALTPVEHALGPSTSSWIRDGEERSKQTASRQFLTFRVRLCGPLPHGERRLPHRQPEARLNSEPSTPALRVRKVGYPTRHAWSVSALFTTSYATLSRDSASHPRESDRVSAVIPSALRRRISGSKAARPLRTPFSGCKTRAMFADLHPRVPGSQHALRRASRDPASPAHPHRRHLDE